MRARSLGILATGVAFSALITASDALAFKGGGGGGGGGGVHFGGGGGGFHMGGGGGGGWHMGGGSLGGIHGFSMHGLSMHGLSTHGLSVHGPSVHALSMHNFASHPFHHYAGNLSYRHWANRHLAGHNLEHLGHDHNLHVAHNELHNLRNEARITKNEFAAKHFQNLHEFKHDAFNRNAFGNNHDWNRWGHRFWAAGWNQWGYGWGCWAGPVFWPFLYGDVFAFAFWPYDYYDSFWAIGVDFLLASIFAPGPYFGLDYGYWPDYYPYEAFPPIAAYGGGVSSGAVTGGTQPVVKMSRADREALAETNAAANESCSGVAPDVAGLPVDQIRRAIRPTADQENALNDVSSTSAKASEIIKASCPTEVPLTPITRLDAAVKRFDAMIEAVQLMRSPLGSLYDGLTDEQKKRFDTMEGSGKAGTGRANLTTLCGSKSESVAKLPFERIALLVKPDAQQQQAFDDLKKAAAEAADTLQTSCPAAMPQTPVARLDAVKTRLASMTDALKIIRPKLETFYNSLNDEQKARFNIMGPPSQSSSLEQRKGG
jgi:hypothetical protein